MKVAIVHDWLNQRGGAERVLEVLHEMYPYAPIYTSIFAPDVMPQSYRSWDIRTSFMQYLPFAKRHHQPFLPLYPLAFRSLRLKGYDIIISNSSGFCHGITVPSGTCHINYCLTPPRYLWNLSQYLDREGINIMAKKVLPRIIEPLRDWDRKASQQVSHFIAISQAVADRIRHTYHRESALIYPPVDAHQFWPTVEIGDYFLLVSRLVPYKRVDLAVQAFNQLGLPLIIVGEGRDRPALEDMAGPNIRFLGHLPQGELPSLLARCKAFIFPGEEDFGIAPLEAQAAGRPVIAYAAGGALDTVIDGVTGLFFYEPTPESLADAIRHFDVKDYLPATIRGHAMRFDTEVFKSEFSAFVQAQYSKQKR